MTLLSLKGVTRRYGGLVAVDAVDLDVAEGGVTAVIGPNGAGKTTLFNLISGFQTPNAGRIVFAGEDVTAHPPEQIAAAGLVRTFQLVQLFQNLSVLENIQVGCHLHTRGGVLSALLRSRGTRQAEREVEARARELLHFVGLEGVADMEASALAYGQQRLLEIARGLAAKPRLLLLDEPAAGLVRRRVETPVGCDPRDRCARHDRAADRARHEAGDEHGRHHRRAGFRPQDCRGATRGGPRKSRRHCRLSRGGEGRTMPDLSYLPQIALSGIAVGCIYGLIGIGFCVIYNASGIVNFAQGAFVMLGGMIAYSALKAVGLPLPVAAAAAIVAVAAVGVIIERIVVRPLWDRKATMFVMILATLAAQIVVERLALIVAGDQPRTLPPFSDLPPIRLGTVVISYQFLWIVGISLLLIVLLDQFFKRTRTGKAMRACAFNREAASLQGINVSRMLALSFALSAGLGAVAGVLITPTQYTAFNVGVPFAISGFIAAIVGGFGRPLGAFIGGIMLGLAQSLAIVAFGAGLKNVAALSVLLIFLFIRPGGILGEAK